MLNKSIVNVFDRCLGGLLTELLYSIFLITPRPLPNRTTRCRGASTFRMKHGGCSMRERRRGPSVLLLFKVL